jgi:hypothetical protein
MKLALACSFALAALAALGASPRADAAGTMPVTSGNVIAARPVGAQPMATMVRPTIASAPLVIAQPFAVTQQPIVIGQPFAITQPSGLTQPALAAPLVVTPQPVVTTQQPIVIGQPFAIIQTGVVQQQIPIAPAGSLLTSQGAALLVR